MEMDKYLGRFRGVEPPRELRVKVLESARGRLRDGSRDGSRDGWILGVAALVLILLTAVNVHLEARVRALVNGRVEVAPAKAESDAPLLVDSFQSRLRLRSAGRRTRNVGAQSWLKLRADIASVGIERSEG